MTVALVRTDAVPQEIHPLHVALEPWHAQIAAMLPADVPVQRVIQELIVAGVKNPTLVTAIKAAPASAVAAIAEAIQTGLVIGKTVYLVPFKNSRNNSYDFTVMASYQGYLELMDASGMPSEGAVVWDCDTFKFALGSSPFVEHVPGPASRRTQVVAAYAIGHRRRGVPPLVKVVQREEIEAVRAKSKEWNPTKVGPLEKVPWYATKTAIRRLASQGPKNPRLAALLVREEPDFGEISATATIADEPTAAATADPDTGAVAALDDGLTLAEAENVTVNKRALGQMRNSGLTASLAWAREKLDASDGGDDSRLVRIAAACTMLLAAREAGTLVEPRKTAKPAAASPPPIAPTAVAAPAPDDDLPF